MKLVRLSPMQIINIEAINRIQVYQSQEIRYVSLHFQGGESYRCTEEETEVLMKVIDQLVQDPS